MACLQFCGCIHLGFCWGWTTQCALLSFSVFSTQPPIIWWLSHHHFSAWWIASREPSKKTHPNVQVPIKFLSITLASVLLAKASHTIKCSVNVRIMNTKRQESLGITVYTFSNFMSYLFLPCSLCLTYTMFFAAP